MIVTAFRPVHLSRLALQEAQAHLGGEIAKPGFGAQLAGFGPAFTALDGDRVLGVAGVAMQWENRGVAWAMLSTGSGRHFTAIHRAAAGFFKQTAVRRIETFVEADFGPGHRWMQMLGFEAEGVARCYTPQGKDCVIYAKVK